MNRRHWLQSIAAGLAALLCWRRTAPVPYDHGLSWTVSPWDPAKGYYPVADSDVHTGKGYGKGRVIHTKRSGYWNDPDTWEGGVVPTADNCVDIESGHFVIHDGDEIYT